MQETLGENIYVLVIMCTGGVSLLVISFVLLFIRNQKKLLKNREQIHEAEMNHQRALTSAIIQSQEEERKRIGSDLHDEVGGALSNLRIMVNRLDNPAEKAGKAALADTYKELIDKIIQDVRNISHNLSPPTLSLFGFSAALEELGDAVNSGAGPVLSVTNHASVITEKMPYQVALALIRILQELITNTVKHSGAKLIGISIYVENDLLLVNYTDSGKGFDADAPGSRKGMGMQNIESRINMIGASYAIKTAPDQGFSLVITIDPNTFLVTA